MAQETINLGTGPDTDDADTIRVALTKTQNNFSELYANMGSDVDITTSAFNTANAAFRYANTKAPAYNVANAAYAFANTKAPAFDVANSGYDTANLAYVITNTSFGIANLAFGIANLAFGNANVTHTYALGVNQNVVSAFGFANTVNSYAYGVGQNTRSAFGTANGGFLNSNLAFGIANIAYNISNNTWQFANSISDYANTINITAVGAFAKVNSVAISANLYTQSVGLSGNIWANATFAPVIHGHAIIEDKANAAFDTTNISFGVANAAYNYANAIGSSSNYNTINLAFDQANAAYVKGNTVASSLAILDSRVTNDQPFRNRLINGNMKINQQWGEGNQVSFVIYRDGFGCDGWALNYVASPSAHFEFTTPNTGGPEAFTHYTKIRCLNPQANSLYYSNSTNALVQPLEGLNMTDFNWGTANASNITVSFWISSSNTGPFGGSIVNGPKNKSYTFSYNVDQADTWEYKVIKIPGPTSGVWYSNNNTGLILRFDLGSVNAVARTMTSNTWLSGDYYRPNNTMSLLTSTSHELRLTGVQLEKGDNNTAFELRPFETELAMCQRYCEKSWDITTGAWGSLGSGYGFANNANGAAFFTAKSTSEFYNGGVVHFKTRKRTQPTVTGYSCYDGAVWSFRDTVTGLNAGTISVANSGETSARVYSSSAGLTAARDYQFHWIARADLPV